MKKEIRQLYLITALALAIVVVFSAPVYAAVYCHTDSSGRTTCSSDDGGSASCSTDSSGNLVCY